MLLVIEFKRPQHPFERESSKSWNKIPTHIVLYNEHPALYINPKQRRWAMGKADGSSLIASGKIESLILLMRGEKVILDADLAKLYGVPTFRFNEAIKRNHNRFPRDFVFQLTREEVSILISQNAISRPGHGGRRTLPYAFTGHGAVMAATVLSSPRAIEMSIFVVRAFIHLRNLLSTHKELALKLAEVERKIETHDGDIRSLFDAIHELMSPPENPKRRIGFHAE
jgi:hypothetical protein